MKRNILIALCSLAIIYIAKISIGVIGLARHQEVTVLAICFELTLYIGAVIFPFLSALCLFQKKLWHFILWIPCILYVIGITINYLFRAPGFAASFFIGILLLLGWLAIAFTFTREYLRKRIATRPSEPPN